MSLLHHEGYELESLSSSKTTVLRLIKEMSRFRLYAAKRVLREIGCHSSVHGMHYVVKGSLASRIIWSFAILVSASVMVTFTSILWMIYLSGKSEVALLSTRDPAYKRHFPAVYVCPEPSFKKHVMREALHKLLNSSTPLSKRQMDAADYLAQSLGDSWYHRWPYLKSSLEAVRRLLGENAVTLLDNLNLESIMLERGIGIRDVAFSYSNETSENATCNPRISGMAGDGTGVYVVFNQSGSALRSGASNVWVGTSSPFSQPALSSDTMLTIAPGEGAQVRVSAAGVTVSSGFTRIPEAVRQCYYEQNGSLKASYSAVKCLSSRYFDEAMRVCGCVPASLLHVKQLGSGAKPCNFTSMSCVYELSNDRALKRAAATTCIESCEMKSYTYGVKKRLLDMDQSQICAECFQLSVFHGDYARGIFHERRQTMGLFAILCTQSFRLVAV
ncbi:uncharacterized protein LOC117648509 [Thrips palmi]|uniref:Uncharacterized protein LOC117648509 n=1 Tax=Thrips palmi TaxID=161013 RepID=A0A6P8ZCY1_THRPL|nr:uncharacterized protein LOC117648509 [Thrips palmi]